jgi:DNA modification methylase
LWSQDRDGINEFHPTQKPVALAAKAIGNHLATSVLDLFCGSGSTLIAAQQLNRKCYGMEISPQYCDVIVKRWEILTGMVAVRETSVKTPA